ncbi:hypothetical protein QFC22_000881 [Naganishia vaughanmartiniae]|uniref:Uncharacterized protein n=1 Tax=Naganishia vaughanmartiniae TaxID=1424756 RepID=A0ACC2XKB3_9TREE|nr:hypothetical protein QFC22_000881 [Naganishia vaughanmartiniae]
MSTNTNSKKAGEAREATASNAIHIQGNSAYKKGKWVDAIGHYTTASVLAPQDPAPLLNRAQAYLKIEKWQDAERDCSRVLGLAGQKGNVKALYRRALARKELKSYKDAKSDLEVLLKTEPTNAAAKEELVDIKRLIKNEANAPNPNKSPKDISSFGELSSKRTNSTASSLPARDRAQGVKVPIKIVPKFTTRPAMSQDSDAAATQPPVKSVSSQPDQSPKSQGVQASSTSPAASGSTFSSHKTKRDAKSSFTASPTIAAASSSIKAPVENQESGRASSGVKPPSSGLELVDRLQDLAEQGDARWQLLQSVTPQKMAALVGGILEPDHLALIYSAMSHCMLKGITREERESIASYMRALRSIPRWQMTEALLLPEERKAGEDLWKLCNT